jgi:hypothetical protein
MRQLALKKSNRKLDGIDKSYVLLASSWKDDFDSDNP